MPLKVMDDSVLQEFNDLMEMVYKSSIRIERANRTIGSNGVIDIIIVDRFVEQSSIVNKTSEFYVVLEAFFDKYGQVSYNNMRNCFWILEWKQ